MKWTKSARIAMDRLAEAHGFEILSTGRGWEFQNAGPTAIGQVFTALSALCFMVRVATAPLHWQGRGMSAAEVRELIRYRPVHVYSRGVASLQLPARIASTDESTLYKNFLNPEVSE